jgi:hypothetical protein
MLGRLGKIAILRPCRSQNIAGIGNRMAGERRTVQGSALMTPGSLLPGNDGACFECGHPHSRGDRCLACHFSPEVFESVVAAIPVCAALDQNGSPSPRSPTPRDERRGLTPGAYRARRVILALSAGRQ